MINILNFGKRLSEEQKIIVRSTKYFCESYLKPRVIQDYNKEIIVRRNKYHLWFNRKRNRSN